MGFVAAPLCLPPTLVIFPASPFPLQTSGKDSKPLDLASLLYLLAKNRKKEGKGVGTTGFCFLKHCPKDAEHTGASGVLILVKINQGREAELMQALLWEPGHLSALNPAQPILT